MFADSASRSRIDVRVAAALAAILIAALGLRLYGLNWDDGRDLHPDELFIAKIVLIDRIHFDWPPDLGQLLDPAKSGLNPRSADPKTGQYREFAYGALPLWVTDAAGWALSRATGVDWNGPDRIYLVGRVLSALFDVGTVFLVFVLGRLLASDAVGLAAAAIAACAPMSIQLAHFFTTDSWLTFFVTLCLVCSVVAAMRGAFRWFCAAGFAVGLAMATKGSVFTLAVPVVVAAALDARNRAMRSERGGKWRKPLIERLLLAGVAAFVGFALFEPYALMNPGIYVQSLRTQTDIVRGAFDVPFTRQYVGRPPILYQIEQFGRWGFGPAATLLAFLGLIRLLNDVRRRRCLLSLVLLSWLVAYGIVIAIPEVRFLRYLAPLVPVFAVAAGLALVHLARLARCRFGRIASIAAAAAALAGVGLWTAAFASIYAHENPRLAASRWIYANVPAGSALTAEYWDDSLPRDLGAGLTPGDAQYATVTMDLYSDQPPRQEAAAIYRVLQSVDYVILSSNRVESGVGQAPWRYPVQERYYDALRSGALGFKQVAAFQLPPSLGPLVFDDRDADESFINYDHPRVEIYQKESLATPDQFRQAMAPAFTAAWTPTRHPPATTNPMLARPVGEMPVVDDVGWSAALTGSAGPALVVWIALLILLQLIGAPLARALLPRFADGGWGLARLFAILLAGYLVWLGASVGLFEFRAVWCAAAVLAVAALSWRLRRRRPAFAVPRGNMVAAEIVFWAVFALFLTFRFLNPDSWHPIWGGEKPMEFAHLNATLRSANFPPYDPWYAGGILNYYYYGLYLVAYLLKLTGIPTRIGFNLAQPTVIALLASAAFSVAATLGRDASRLRRLAVPAGLLGVLLTVLVGNLTSAIALFQPLRPPLDSFLDWVWAGSRAIPDAITEFPFFTGLYADLHAHVVALPMTVAAIALSYDLAQRPLRVCRAAAAGEMARVFLGAVVRLAPLMLVIGGLSATNAWDVPTYAALGLAALFMATRDIAGWARRMTAFVACAAAFGAGSYLLFLPFHRHFVALFGSLARVKEPTDLGAWASHLGGLLAIVVVGLIVLSLPTGRSPAPIGSPVAALGAAALLVAAGIVLGPIAPTAAPIVTTALVALAIGLLAVIAWHAAGALPGAMRDDAMLARVWVVAATAAAGLAFFAGWAVLALYLAVGMLAATRWMIGRRVAPRFVALLAAAAAFVGAGVELFVVADDLIGTTAYRMNTIFKFYNQLWVLLALAGAASIAVMLRASGLLRRTRATSAPAGDAGAAEPIEAPAAPLTPSGARRAWAVAAVALSVVVIAASLVYPILAISPRLHQRFTDQLGTGGLDALDWMRYGTVASYGPNGPAPIRYDGDLAAVEWLQQHVPGSPVIAEASIGPYRCNGSRFSIDTGLPTIIGWQRHEEQQRPADGLQQRVDDVRTLYTSPDPAAKLAILRKYDVQYVIVGDLERVYPAADNDCTPQGSADGIAAFDQMVGTSLEQVFAANGTTIYRVVPAGAATR